MLRFNRKIRFAAKNGFTLIELLVVISIIAILSSIVLASLANARAGANIGAGEQFDSSVYDALGEDAVAVFNFDEGLGNGSTINDSSGYGNTGIMSASGVTRVPGESGNALNFSGGEVTINAGSVLNGVFATNNFTITAWIYTGSPTVRQTIYSSGYNLGVQPFNFGTSANTPGGLEVYWPGVYVAYTTGNQIPANKWVQVAYSRNGPGTDEFFIDGHSVPLSTSLNSSFGANSGSQYIGLRADNGYPFEGVIDQIRIYSDPLSAVQLQTLYAEEAPKYSVAIK